MAQEFSGSLASVNLHAQATSFARLSETDNGGSIFCNPMECLRKCFNCLRKCWNFWD
ncbi:predicted protein [Arabidopsis lyrata subsp. lyrata]|uniref:Predicted protein n=1 Tax=Arabidopsis lyrata subsp. lyrata TaxID=81972 RepID=D7KPQ9_ARALL|nr:predicted protein [Arabidopsis lyrata subsp. lyrata]